MSSTLSCIETEKNTKPLVDIHHFNHQTSRGNPPLQSPNLSWKSTTSITKPLVGFSHFNQSGNIGQHMAWDLFSLPASTADSTLLLHSQGQMDPHTPPPPLSMASSITASWPRYGHLVIAQAIRRKSRSQWSILQFMNRFNCDRICIQKFSCFSGGRGHLVLACLLGCL